MNKQADGESIGRDTTIDGLRGLAALAVVIHHILHFAVKSSNDPGVVALTSFLSVDYLDWGRFGVVLFFLISGYVVPEYLIKGGSLSAFAVQRLLRIYPVFWISIVFLAIYRYFDVGSVVPLRHVLGNATLFPQVVSAPWLSGVYWTLNIEVLFYAACGMLFLANQIARPLAWQIVCVLTIASTVLPIASNYFHWLESRLPVQFTGFYISFLVSGVLLRSWSQSARASKIIFAMLPFLMVPVVAGIFSPFPVVSSYMGHGQA